ncbi:negative transcription regulator PadR [Rhizocola hellebori]|uniref:Negative transcription regulator PadR n=1 Tax=Rhizocola hellebori TaxID=1392758 RepID=A0A8J3QG99_9ACTN|nr:PadR family transcriptional regulator [Rhizocola hellebori]GIH09991.1 negative transcription regulator PadR [Rhizocola hellebori]
MSTLGFALLSLLTRGPATGYQLTRRMQNPIGHFWTANHSQIYPELARLSELGHVTATEGAGPGPRAKKTYSLTARGREALADWLPKPAAFQPRNEVALKAYAAACAADRSRMAELYEQVAADAAAALAAFGEEESTMVEHGWDDISHPKFGNYAVLQLGIGSQRNLHAWATWLASQLRQ